MTDQPTRQTKIIIFNPDLSVGAIITIDPQKTAVETYGEFSLSALDEIQEKMTKGQLNYLEETWDEGGKHSSMQATVVLPGQPEYAAAVLAELHRQQFVAAEVAPSAIPILLKLSSPEIPFNKRQEVVPELILMEEQALAALGDDLAALASDWTS